MILDSNIIIYSALPENQVLRDFVEKNTPFYSAISLVEVLGFHKLSETDVRFFGEFFDSLTMIVVSEPIVKSAIMLRQQRRMGLGDSIIAATAIVNSLPLVTRNTKDFEWIDKLELLNPLDQ